MLQKNSILETIYLKIAGFTLAVNFHKIEPPFFTEKNFRDRVYYYCYGFLIAKPKKIDYQIDFIHQQFFETYIKFNKKKNFINISETHSKNKLTSFYHISDDHLKLILRTICQQLLVSKKGMLFHSSAALINNQADVFLGDSGAGKSTIVSLLSDECSPLADDIIILKSENKTYFFYQTPFKEKNIWIIKNSEKIPLGRIFFLKKSNINKLEKVTNTDFILNNFLKQFLTDQADYKKQLPQMTKLLRDFDKFYILHFSLNNRENLITLLKNG